MGKIAKSCSKKALKVPKRTNISRWFSLTLRLRMMTISCLFSYAVEMLNSAFCTMTVPICSLSSNCWKVLRKNLTSVACACIPICKNHGAQRTEKDLWARLDCLSCLEALSATSQCKCFSYKCGRLLSVEDHFQLSSFWLPTFAFASRLVAFRIWTKRLPKWVLITQMNSSKLSRKSMRHQMSLKLRTLVLPTCTVWCYSLSHWSLCAKCSWQATSLSLVWKG